MNDNPEITASSENENRSPLNDIFDYVEVFVLAACAVLLLFTFVFRICRVDGSSMNNTLESNEKLMISDLFYTPEQGDIIVFHQTSDTVSRLNEPLVKRVIATEGQYVKIDYRRNTNDISPMYLMDVYVSDDDNFTDDEKLTEEYINLEGDPDYPSNVYHVPDGHIFVLGDNRYNSADSRYFAVGYVDERRVLGKVLLRVLPISKLGTVN